MRISICSQSDQHEISPCSINALENRVVMRIECMIKEDESNKLLKFQQILPTTSIEKVKGQ